MAALIPWFFLTVAVVMLVIANVMPWQTIQEYQGLMFRIITGCLLAGWLSDIWRNKDRIRRRLALIILLGYYVWMAATDNIIKFTTKSVAIETAAFLCVMVFALTRSTSEAKANRDK